jgi:hypothetical protein
LEPRDSFLEHQCDEALSPLQRSGAHWICGLYFVVSLGQQT